MRNYYKTLGVPEKASQDEIKEAYRKLVKQWHPDRNLSDPMLQEMMKLYNAAYETLSDPIARHRHDVSLGLRSGYVDQRPHRDDSNTPGAAVPSGISLAKHESYNSSAYEQAAFSISCNIRLGGICLIIGIVSLIYYAVQVHHFRTAAQWPTVDGSITDYRATIGGKYSCLQYATLYYKYTVDDVEYNGFEILNCVRGDSEFRNQRNAFLSKYAKEPLIIHYDYNDPHRSLIDLNRAISLPSSFVSKYPLYIAAFGFGIALYMLSDWLDRRIKYNKKLKRDAEKELRAP